MTVKVFLEHPMNPHEAQADMVFDYTSIGRLPAVVVYEGVFYELVSQHSMEYYVHNPYSWIDHRPKVIADNR